MRYLWLLVCLVCFVILMGKSARADEWLTTTVASYHVKREVGHNGLNLGLGFERTVTQELRVIGGAYRNSSWRTSTYLGLAYLPYSYGPARFGVAGGLVTGYGVPVLAVPVMSIEGRSVGINVTFVPGYLVGAQLKWRLE